MDFQKKDGSVDITVIVPCYNEREFIVPCLDSLLLAVTGTLAEIVVVDGMSSDGTRELVAQFAQDHPRLVRVLDNTQRYQVHALNLGISAARGRYLVRCDAHAVYPEGYLRNFMDFYDRDTRYTFGNVGVHFNTISNCSNKSLRAGIGLAMASKIGVGMSHRSELASGEPVDVDTLLFGAWRKETFTQTGPFDETFIRGQDYEHNLRIRRLGKRICLIPGVAFTYYTRASFRKMRQMVFQYAYVKGQLVRRDRRAPNLRSLIPGIGLAAFAALTIFDARLALGAAAVYCSILVSAGLAKIGKCSLRSVLGMVFAFPQMHLYHALGFWYGLLSDPNQQAFIQRKGGTR